MNLITENILIGQNRSLGLMIAGHNDDDDYSYEINPHYRLFLQNCQLMQLLKEIP
jgi:hypothetical protein